MYSQSNCSWRNLLAICTAPSACLLSFSSVAAGSKVLLCQTLTNSVLQLGSLSLASMWNAKRRRNAFKIFSGLVTSAELPLCFKEMGPIFSHIPSAHILTETIRPSNINPLISKATTYGFFLSLVCYWQAV